MPTKTNGRTNGAGDAQPSELIVCSPRRLPDHQQVEASHTAVRINPVNRAPVERLTRLVPSFKATAEHLAVLTTKYWHTAGVRLTAGFLDGPPQDLRTRIIGHMNAWAKTANVHFTESSSSPQVRIARVPRDGYWSNLGTDILHVPADRPTMNLDSFTMATPDSEFHRVVRHETGHTLGFPHEHMRRQLVALIDVKKAIAYFGATQGWPPEEVRQQVLTPIEDASLWSTDHADPHSIMCYQIPGSITKTGKPIPGGGDIDAQDYAFASKVYPKKVHAPVHAEASPTPSTNGWRSEPLLYFPAGADPQYVAAVVSALRGN